jgi:hypothetical protein
MPPGPATSRTAGLTALDAEAAGTDGGEHASALTQVTADDHSSMSHHAAGLDPVGALDRPFGAARVDLRAAFPEMLV